MSKRKILFISAIVCSLVLICAACGSSDYIVISDAQFLSYSRKESIKNGNFDYDIITEYDGLKNLIGEDKLVAPSPYDSYDSKFFESNNLLLLNIPGQGAKKTVDLKSKKLNDGVLTVNLKVVDDSSPFIDDTYTPRTITVLFSVKKDDTISSVAVDYI